MDCHYVSKFLTKQWESENRKLSYYDFTTNKIDYESNLKLFSRIDVNTPEQKIFFNKYIESPLTDLRNIVLEKKKIKKWKVYRAIYLLGLLQAPRFFKDIDADDYFNNDLIVNSENTLDSMVHLYDELFCIRSYILPSEDRLFFPELGFFFLPFKVLEDPLVYKFAYCIPIDPKILILICPRNIDEDYTSKLLSCPQLIMGFSVGIKDYCNKVVIPPKFLEMFTNEKIIEAIKHWRSESDSYLRMTTSLINNITDLYKIFDLDIKFKNI